MNPFERYSEQTKTAHERRRERTQTRRRANALIKKQEERSKLEHGYRLGMLKLVEGFLEKTGEKGQRLIDLLDGLTVKDGNKLLEVAATFKSEPLGIRLDAQHFIACGMMAARVKAGLAPFDDPLEGRHLFAEIRDMLTGDAP